MQFEGERERYLQLRDGHRIEGPVDGGLDFRLMRYAYNDVALPDRTETRDSDDPQLLPTGALLAAPGPEAGAELHKRLAPPLLALGFALLALPLGRSSPRQQRYGRLMLGFLAYLVCVNLMFIGSRMLAQDELPGLLGLWWLTLPLLTLAIWLYLRDGRLSRPRRAAA
jgi:lipopolysaccharide export system permease protein